ncbi:MAG: winged helix-turn-helix transcriptional regulator [Clostridia bacterium]|nr:winged helix-turn-helix transcriptional regulator [Clostridia bacterium]
MGKTELTCDCEIVHKEKVEKAKDYLIEENKLLKITELYKAMSDSTRIKIINILKDNELCVCDIAVILNMTKSAVSHQLKNLREKGIIKSRKDGKMVLYTLADEHIRQIFSISAKHINECN